MGLSGSWFCSCLVSRSRKLLYVSLSPATASSVLDVELELDWLALDCARICWMLGISIALTPDRPTSDLHVHDPGRGIHHLVGRAHRLLAFGFAVQDCPARRRST